MHLSPKQPRVLEEGKLSYFVGKVGLAEEASKEDFNFVKNVDWDEKK
jgi:hypothetical protein